MRFSKSFPPALATRSQMRVCEKGKIKRTHVESDGAQTSIPSEAAQIAACYAGTVDEAQGLRAWVDDQHRRGTTWRTVQPPIGGRKMPSMKLRVCVPGSTTSTV